MRCERKEGSVLGGKELHTTGKWFDQSINNINIDDLLIFLEAFVSFFVWHRNPYMIYEVWKSYYVLIINCLTNKYLYRHSSF